MEYQKWRIMMTSKNDLHNYRSVVSNTRINHDAYANILNELIDAYNEVGTTALPVCLLITGESRTGKSSVVRDLLMKYLPSQNDGQIIRTIVYAVAPAKATVKSLLESLLYGLGDPFWARGTVVNMTQRLYTLLDAVQCKMIILDEFQHLCDKGQKHSLHLLADWLKVLLEGGKYGLVAVGLPSAASIIHGHPQLVGRFDGELKMPLFDWMDESSAQQFRVILGQFQDELKLFQMPALDNKNMGFRIFLASAGRIGLVAKILERAVRNAVHAGTFKIELKDLKVAYDRAIWSASLFPVPGGPFGAEIGLLQKPGIQDSVLANAAMEEVADKSSSVLIFDDRKTVEVESVQARNSESTRKDKNQTTKKKSGNSKERQPVRKRPNALRDLRRAL
ncbi:MAG TPA: TniB family NTP-binding protein [Arenimonas sp.]|nr:TniB family NTP-binding protein [Arenimonas sp.]